VKAWNYKKWATLHQPVHKSDLSSLTSSTFGCTERFRRRKDSEEGAAQRTDTIWGKRIYGTAVHETIARALSSTELSDRLLGGGAVSLQRIDDVFAAEVIRAAEGREIVWYGKADSPDKLASECVAMIHGLLTDLHRWVAKIMLVEPGFISPLGDYWIAGYTDLVFRPRSNPSGIAFADWKTGVSLPHQIELDHGFESGFYAQALSHGSFLQREFIESRGNNGLWSAHSPYASSYDKATRFDAERACMESSLVHLAEVASAEKPTVHFGEFPSELYYVHLRDYIPYEKSGTKQIDRSEQLAFYGQQSQCKVRYAAGDTRGPAWYSMRRTKSDVPRLEHLLRRVVKMVRMGVFFESIDGNKCSRCPFRNDCLNDGYELRGEEKKDAERVLRNEEIDFDGLGGVA